MTRHLVGSWSALLLVVVCGCQTAPLGGTQWNVIEFVEPDADDRDALAEIDTMTIRFEQDGTLITTTVLDDGSATIEDDERYAVAGDVLTITHPDYTTRAMYRFEGDQLRIHAPQFIVLMNPIHGD